MFSNRLDKWSLLDIMVLHGVEAEGSVMCVSHFEQSNGMEVVIGIVQGLGISFDLIEQSSVDIGKSYAVVSFNFNLSQSNSPEKPGILRRSL